MWKGEWNNSALRLLQDCGERFRRRYIEGETSYPFLRMVRGTVVHRVASQALLRKMANDPLPSVEEARDQAATAFAAAEKSGISYSDEDMATGPAVARGLAKDFAVDLSGYHVGHVAPAIHPVAVERRIVVRPKDSDLVIHGTIDLIDREPVGEVIRDKKTTEKSPPADAAEDSQQLSMYAMIRMAEVGALPHHLALDYLVRTPVRHEMKTVTLETTRTPADVSALVSRLNTAVEAVKRGIFVPANPDAWYCSKQFCEYWTTCPYTSRGLRRPRS
jgi:RecB family exonuclease